MSCFFNEDLQSGCSESLGGRSVNLPAIPTDDQRPLKLLPELPDEFDDSFGVNVVIVNLKRSPDATVSWRKCDSPNDAQSIIAIPGPLDGRLTTRSPGATIDRLQAKAGFIEKNYAGTVSTRFF